MGARCPEFADPDALAKCDATQELTAAAAALEPGLVVVVDAGYIYKTVAGRISAIAVVCTALGVAYGRVELTVDPATGRVTAVAIHPPQRLCTGGAARGRLRVGGAIVRTTAGSGRTAAP